MKNIVLKIREDILSQGEAALFAITKEVDKIALESFIYKVPQNIKIDKNLAAAIKIAKKNIEKFHKAEYKKLYKNNKIETSSEIFCWKKFTPIQNVGLYVPNGLFSSLLMNVIPAQIAGCSKIIICTPPNPSQEILYVCRLLKINKIYTIGGAQAIFAMAYGVGEISKVDKIFGPGNEFVNEAKKLVSCEVAIDMPAGPSEVLIIGDENTKTYDAIYDLLAQLEHGKESRAWLFSSSDTLIKNVQEKIMAEIKKFPRQEILQKSINNLVCKKFNNIVEALDESNKIAPEHLILNIKDAENYLDLVKNAGSVFVGKYTTESLGDYLSGTNHVLPTSGFAKSFSGLSVLSFGKFITFQTTSKQGLESVAAHVATMAKAEGLNFHAESILSRL